MSTGHEDTDTATEKSAQTKWKEAHPQAIWAQSALRSGIRKGLTSRGPCEVCGAEHGTDGVLVDGHHDDYDRPLAVRWLCRQHHRDAHNKQGTEQ